MGGVPRAERKHDGRREKPKRRAARLIPAGDRDAFGATKVKRLSPRRRLRYPRSKSPRLLFRGFRPTAAAAFFGADRRRAGTAAAFFGVQTSQSVSQSLPHSYQQSTWLLDLQRTRSTIASVERANLWNGVCAQLHASAIRTRWSAESWHRATFCLLPYWLEAVVTRRGSRRSSRGQNRSRSKGTRGVARPTRIC